MPTRTLPHGPIPVPQSVQAYVRHGAIRYRQGYTVPLLIREARLLQASLAERIQRNFTAIEMNYLVPDTIHFMGTIDALLEDSARKKQTGLSY